jgi:hypothetical protein
MKADLVLRGLRLDPSVLTHGRPPTGSVGLELPHRLTVSAPIVQDATGTPYVLSMRGSESFLQAGAADATLRVTTNRPPRFYERATTQGTPMADVATRHGRHLVIAPGGSCGFSVRGTPCAFCLEGARATGTREGRLHPTDVVEVVRAALAEGVVDGVYFNSCAFDAEDGGIAFLAPYIEAVRRHVDTLIAVQVHPPANAAWVDRTYAMGVDAISYNLEIYDADVLLRQCVGRARYIGRERYLEVLAHAARVFPSGTVWSELVLGIEHRDSTIAGIDALAAMGVLPVLAVHRAALSAMNGDGLDGVEAVLAHLFDAVRGQGINMGWVHGLPLGITPLDAGQGRADLPRLATIVRALSGNRLGGMVVRNLARTRRRLRTRKPDDSSHAGA